MTANKNDGDKPRQSRTRGGETRHLCILFALLLTMAGCFHATAEKRSNKVRHDFARAYACPSTGKHALPCPGFYIDHVIPLACGGPDQTTNLQWLSEADWKAKSKWERRECQKRFAPAH